MAFRDDFFLSSVYPMSPEHNIPLWFVLVDNFIIFIVYINLCCADQHNSIPSS